MFAVSLGLWTYLLCVTSLGVIFLIYIVVYSLKVGFKKAIKSWITVGLICAIFICGVLPPLSFIPHSGKRLFKDYLVKPVPKSVEILDSFDGSAEFYPDTCLHFKISSADFPLLLETKEWEANAKAPLGLQCDYKNSAWDFSFPPPALGSDVKTYLFIPRERDFEILFVNAQMNEVYYFYHDGNLP